MSTEVRQFYELVAERYSRIRGHEMRACPKCERDTLHRIVDDPSGTTVSECVFCERVAWVDGVADRARYIVPLQDGGNHE